jgi:hypothetical protein
VTSDPHRAQDDPYRVQDSDPQRTQDFDPYRARDPVSEDQTADQNPVPRPASLPDFRWVAPASTPTAGERAPRYSSLDEPTASLPVTASSPDAGAGGLVALPPREGLRATVAVLAVTLVALLGIDVLGWRAGMPPPVAAQPEPLAVPSMAPPTAPTTPAGPAIYRAPDDLCEQADFTGLRPTFDQIGDLRPDQGSSAGVFQLAQCDGSTGNETVDGRFAFTVTVYADLAAAKKAYDTAYKSVQTHADKYGKLHYPVGEAGYEYLGPRREQGVEIYDGNLRIQLSWDAADGKSAVPNGTVDALTAVCESTMKLLRDQ